MYKILNKQILASDIKRLNILAPEIALKAQPGQYVIVTPQSSGERIPLTVIESDALKGTIDLIFHEVGRTTKQLGNLPINDSIYSILGPLGIPATIGKVGVVVCVATGIGAAQILPMARAFKKGGNKVIGIVGAKTKRSLMLEPQMRLACNKILVTTNDGSYARRGLATEMLKEILIQEKVNLVNAAGSVEMMENICKITQPKGIKTFVYLTPVMVDGIGQCGSCRVRVGGQIRLACVDGPEFDGHQVDYQDLKVRMDAFEDIEKLTEQLKPAQHKRGSNFFVSTISSPCSLKKAALSVDIYVLYHC